MAASFGFIHTSLEVDMVYKAGLKKEKGTFSPPLIFLCYCPSWQHTSSIPSK